MHPQGYIEVNWNPVDMLNLKRFKKAVVSHGMYSSFVRRMLNSWTTKNRIIPQVWEDLVSAVRETILNYSGELDGERKPRPWNNEVGLEVMRFPKTKFLVRVSMLVCKDSVC